MPRIRSLNDLARQDPTLQNNPYLRGVNRNNNNSNNRRNPQTNNRNQNKSQSHKPAPNKNKNNSKCLNPRNEWIVDLIKEKSSKPSHQKYHKNAYAKAIKNIRKCPYEINNEFNAQSIDGIGKSFAKMIKSKLIQRNEYKSEDRETARLCARQKIEKANAEQSKKAAQQKKKNKKKSPKNKRKENGPYTPRLRSGGYAILVYMFEMYKTHNIQGVLKQQIISQAQPYCDSSFTEAKNEYWTAWSGMAKLKQSGYVDVVKNKFAKFYLTETGMDCAKRLHSKHFGNAIPPQPNFGMYKPQWNDEQNSNNNNNGTPNSEEKKKEWKYICEYCNKPYIQKKSFEKHIANKHKNGAKNDKNESINHNKRKRNISEIMELDSDTELEAHKPKKAKIIDTNETNVKSPILINGEWYELHLIYDTSEERTKKRKERVSLANYFSKTAQIHSKPYRLPIADFVWTLQSVSNPNKEYLYPLIIERKRMDDLAVSITDKRYIEQKWRIKKNLPRFRHIYLIEEYSIDEQMRKRVKTALINTQIRDGFLVFHTSNFIQCMRVLAQWTRLIYEEIVHKNENILSECVSFESFKSKTEIKKNLNISAQILFGRQLMTVNGVTDIIAKQIILKYPTLRCLYNAWDECESDTQKQKYLLFNQVNGTCLEWHRDLDSGFIELDKDLRNVCFAMNNTKYKPISKKLSEKIWNAFYFAME